MAATNINRSVDHKFMKEKMKKDAESDEDEQTGGGAPEDDRRKRLASAMKKASVAGGSGGAGGGSDSSMKSCQAENCAADLTDAKTYHRRHKVCEVHAKAQVVVVAGIRQRFCQQCSRFHELSEFDEAKRSCRRRLAGHNERRRKNPSGNPSNGQLMKDMVCGQVDDRGRIQITVQENANYKHFHVL